MNIKLTIVIWRMERMKMLRLELLMLQSTLPDDCFTKQLPV